MRNLFRIIAVAAASAAATYYFDPELGRRRRALVRDKLDAVSHDARDLARAKRKHVANRLKGLVATARAPFAASSAPASERQLRERIRSRLGRLVSHPGAIEVVVNQGSVSLRGLVLADEVETLLSSVLAMPGVEHIDNRLSVHDEPGSIPSLQGGGRPHRAIRGGSRPVLPLMAMAAPLAMMLRRRRAARQSGVDPHPMH